MAENDEYRIDGAIERVGFYKWRDPEAIYKLQKLQRMYERIADEEKHKKNIPFDKVLDKVKKKNITENESENKASGEQ